MSNPSSARARHSSRGIVSSVRVCWYLAESLVRKGKELIDRTYKDCIELSEIARLLRTTHSNMTKAFTGTYGITPISYRNRLRIMESLWNILTSDVPMVENALNVGFRDLSRFNKQFKSHISTSPVAFRRGKKSH